MAATSAGDKYFRSNCYGRFESVIHTSAVFRIQRVYVSVCVRVAPRKWKKGRGKKPQIIFFPAVIWLQIQKELTKKYLKLRLDKSLTKSSFKSLITSSFIYYIASYSHLVLAASLVGVVGTRPCLGSSYIFQNCGDNSLHTFLFFLSLFLFVFFWFLPLPSQPPCFETPSR